MQTAELLRSLGHEVHEYKLAHPQLLTTFTPRWAAGIRDDALGHDASRSPRRRLTSRTTPGPLRSFNHGSPYVCYTPTWNYVGQAAASVPAGFDSDGLPMAIQLAAPPHGETTIVSLAAQLEVARPWQHRRPDLLSRHNNR